MATISGRGQLDREAKVKTANGNGEIQVFDDFTLFSKAVQDLGVTLDLSSLLSLYTNFLGFSEGTLVLNIKHFNEENPNNLLVMSGEKSTLYTKAAPPPEALQALSRLFTKRHGKGTAIAYLILKRGVANYKAKLESLINSVKELASSFDAAKYRELALDFERLFDRLEDLQEILIKLEETELKEVDPRYISFDYKVLMAESSNLLDRCKNRFNMLKDLARDHEMQATIELNRRIERLGNIMKRLTALTVILMLPTLIASHFGMNFQYMPELSVKWAYTATVAGQVFLIVAGLFLFKKIGWL